MRYRNEILYGSTVIIEKPRGSPGIIRHCGRPVRTMSLQGVAETEWGGRGFNNLKLLVTQLLEWRASCTVVSLSVSPQ